MDRSKLAQQVWDEALARRGAETVDAVHALMVRHALQRHGSEFAVFRPKFVDAARWDDARATAEGLVALLAKARAHLRARPDGAAWIGVPPTLAALVDAEFDQDRPDPIGRLDGLVDADGRWWVIESTALAGGSFLSELRGRALATTPPMAAVQEAFPVTRGRPLAASVGALEGARAAVHPDAPATFAVVVPEGERRAIGPSELHIAMEWHGWSILGAPASAMRWRDGALWVDGSRVTLLAVGDWSHPAVVDPEGPIHRALRAGAVAALDPCRLPYLHAKAVLALLSDPALGLPLSASERAFVDGAVPWTRIAKPGLTVGPEGDRVDLLRFVLDHREDLVIKPSRGSLGAQVLIGLNATPADWEGSARRVFAAAAPADWVVQRRITPPVDRWPVWSSEGLRFQPFREDLDLFVFDGRRVEGATCRVGPGWVSNLSVSRTNTVTPVMVVGGRP